MQTDNNQQKFEAFTKELSQLSQKYGIVLDCIGGVSFFEPNDEILQSLRYTSDASSWDLEAVFAN